MSVHVYIYIYTYIYMFNRCAHSADHTQDEAKMGQDKAKMGQDEAKMTQERASDAILEACPPFPPPKKGHE